jgi:hypothetical protein
MSPKSAIIYHHYLHSTKFSSACEFRSLHHVFFAFSYSQHDYLLQEASGDLRLTARWRTSLRRKRRRAEPIRKTIKSRPSRLKSPNLLELKAKVTWLRVNRHPVRPLLHLLCSTEVTVLLTLEPTKRVPKGASLANPNKKARKYQVLEFASDEE